MADGTATADELMTEIARYGYILHLLTRARKESEEHGNAELTEAIREAESGARVERNLKLDRLQEADLRSV